MGADRRNCRGPDTEIFYDTEKEPSGPDCRPGCPCGKYFEIWNNVFMEYNKTNERKYEPLKQKNVDTGMGVERTVACLNDMGSVYEIDSFAPLMLKILEIIGSLRSINEDQSKISDLDESLQIKSKLQLLLWPRMLSPAMSAEVTFCGDFSMRSKAREASGSGKRFS